MASIPHNERMTEKTKALSVTAFATLLLVAFMMGANHVAARFAFNNGVDVMTAVSFRSALTALVVGLILWQQKVQIQTLEPHHKKYLPLIGLIIAVQSVCLYSCGRPLACGLGLVGFQYLSPCPLHFGRVCFTSTNPKKLCSGACPVILVGLALALDVIGCRFWFGCVRTLGANWQRCGVCFGGLCHLWVSALVYTQHETVGLDGRVAHLFFDVFGGCVGRGSGSSVKVVFICPLRSAGWWGLGMLSFLYGTAFTILFTVLPRLGRGGQLSHHERRTRVCLDPGVGTCLDQAIAPIQLVGAALVVGTVMWLGLRKR